MSTNFDPIARLYRPLEILTFGRALERCRLHFIPHLGDRRHALVLGDGDGRFLAALLTAKPNLEANAVDTSAAMLRLLTRRCKAFGRLRTHQTDALAYAAAPETDLVAAHFFFDCLSQTDLDQLIGDIARRVRPNTLWLVSDFRIPPGRAQLPARLLVRALYLAFRVLTGLRTTRLPDHETPLRRARLTRVAQHLSLRGLLTTELWGAIQGS